MPEPPLTRFFRQLTTSRAARARFKRDPEGTMTQAGLSRAHQRVIKTRDARLISEAVAAEQPTGGAPTVFLAIIETMTTWWGQD